MQDHGLICLSQATAKGTGATVSRVCSFAVFVGAGTCILVRHTWPCNDATPLRSEQARYQKIWFNK